ncbi:MAG: hypothetical protein AB7E73_03310 [Burkholderiales bacterium]
MYSDAEMQLTYKVGNAPFNMYPYPHFFLQDLFPADFYRRIRQNLPDPRAMMPIEEARQIKGYKERFVLGLNPRDLASLPEDKRTFWSEFAGWLVGANFGPLVLKKFHPFIDQRFGSNSGLEFYDEALLVQDITNYRLGPHTDSPRKVVTLLFYLPADESQKHLGTSMYLPRDPSFTCPGGPHHPHDQFVRLHTNPFLPNSLFAFFKTDNSFHGVEPVGDPDCRRWLLLYDIYVREPASPRAAPVAAAPSIAPNIRFRF